MLKTLGGSEQQTTFKQFIPVFSLLSDKQRVTSLSNILYHWN